MTNTNELLAHAMKLQQANNLQSAKDIYSAILKVNPNDTDALHLMGILHKDLKQFDLAIDYFKKALKLKPKMPQIHHNLGLAYKECGDIESAINHYQQALVLNPSYYKIYLRLANAFVALDERKLALENFQKTVSLKPDYVEAWLSFGNFYKSLQAYNHAKECFQTVLNYQPNSIEANYNLATILEVTKDYETAASYYNKTLQLNPDFSACFAAQTRLYKDICNWQEYEIRQKKLLTIFQQYLQQAADTLPPIDPFTVLSEDWSPENLRMLTQSYSNVIVKQQQVLQKKLNFNFERSVKTRLKIAYFSSDFRNHAIAHLTYNLYASHNRDKFEVFCFSHGPDDNSIYYKYIKNTCDHFVDLCNKSDTEIANAIYKNNIDILIDLNGYTANNKMPVLALKPAPIQVCYLGYAGTTGASFMDYFLVDNLVITDKTAPTYSEKLVYLPNSRQMNNNLQILSDKPLKRSDYQLPETAFVYCCFNNSFKIEPKIFTVWMEILAKNSNSVLWLLATHPLTESNLRHEAEKYHIDPQRLVFAKREEKSVHLARQLLADLFLDTYYFNAHVTASDALWAGLPLLTCPGINFPSRVAASLLKVIGLPELIMPNFEAYKHQAIFFAEHPQELQKIRNKLMQLKKVAPVFDTQRTVKNLERAYEKMWEIYSSGSAPQEIHITESN